MFDVAPTELLLVAVVALVVIGPKDLPKAMRAVGNWVGRAKGMARHFRSGIDSMIRESELQEMEKKWKEENERIMREFPRIEDLSLVGSDSPVLPAADDIPQPSARADDIPQPSLRADDSPQLSLLPPEPALSPPAVPGAETGDEKARSDGPPKPDRPDLP